MDNVDTEEYGIKYVNVELLDKVKNYTVTINIREGCTILKICVFKIKKQGTKNCKAMKRFLKLLRNRNYQNRRLPK